MVPESRFFSEPPEASPKGIIDLASGFLSRLDNFS